VNESDRFDLSDGYALLVFPASHKHEAGRLFAPGSDADHLVFPAPAEDEVPL
jgi:hypothetical protein